jgi:hypothetical protein
MLLSVRNIARTVYGVDRAAQANLGSPVLVNSWERATAATRTTWIGYVKGYLRHGTTPTLGSEVARTDAFTAVMRALSAYTGTKPGRAHGHPYTITITPGNTSEAHPNTLQFTAVVKTWNSATPAKATIDAAGLATTVAAGSSVITASLPSGLADGATITSNASTYTVT